ncbi:MAG: hypothetical protein NZ518_11240, partial [Dehalococcoidia bacterium]|nr:hypothetical protein [Dehalococcoidia bacterium]
TASGVSTSAFTVADGRAAPVTVTFTGQVNPSRYRDVTTVNLYVARCGPVENVTFVVRLR